MNIKSKLNKTTHLFSVVLLFCSFFINNFYQTAFYLSKSVVIENTSQFSQKNHFSKVNLIEDTLDHDVNPLAEETDNEDDEIEFISSFQNYIFKAIVENHNTNTNHYKVCFDFVSKIPLYILFKQLKAFI